MPFRVVLFRRLIEGRIRNYADCTTTQHFIVNRIGIGFIDIFFNTRLVQVFHLFVLGSASY